MKLSKLIKEEHPHDLPPDDKGLDLHYKKGFKDLTGLFNKITRLSDIEEIKKLSHVFVDNLKKASKVQRHRYKQQIQAGNKAQIFNLITNLYMKDSKMTSFEEIDALHENEEYCPKCTTKLRESIKKLVAECWKTHKQVGMKKKGGKTVPNCVPKNEGSSWDGSASKNPGMWDGKPSEKQRNKPFPAMGEEVDEAKTKPAKGKRFAKKVKNKKTGRTRTVSYGQAGKAKKGGDRIRPGTAKGHAYCARSAKIKKCKNPPCANTLSRKKWKCQCSRSVPE